MPQAATLPTHSPDARARPRAQPRTASIEERTAALEARWEETVPTLATSKDISDLRSEMIKWVVGAGLALFAAFAAMFMANSARIDTLATRTDARFDALDAKIDSRFDALMAEIRALRRAE